MNALNTSPSLTAFEWHNFSLSQQTYGAAQVID